MSVHLTVANKHVLAANVDSPGAARVHLIDRPLRCIGVQGEDLPPDVQRSLDEAAKHQASPEEGDESTRTSSSSKSAVAAAEISDAAALLPERADVLVTDLLDHRVLGMGLLSAVDYASSRLLKRGARVVPTHIRVSAMLVEMRITQVSGFDLLGLNRYRWNPGNEKIDLCRVPHKKLSGTFTAIDIDVQQRVDSLSGFPEAHLPEILWESDNTLKVLATCTGRWNAVVFWFTLNTHGDNSVTTWSDSGTAEVCTSWQQCVQYLDETPVTKDTGQLHFAAEPGAKRPRHAWVPRWHFDMVLDEQRNVAYEKAIARAIEIKRALGCKDVSVLDIGAGSGLLSLMAARAGADRVTGAEVGQHMCDVAAEAVVMNGYAAKCLMINKDVRRIDVAAKADGTPPDMEQKANLCVFEVFDSGLIGEGVLHLMAWAQARLLTPDCTLVPMAAMVYCQPIQMRTGRVLGFDMAQANQSQWKALGPVTEVFAFDFYEAEANMQVAEVSVRLTAHSQGVCNAIAFWFSLHLDEETELHTSPYEEKGNTWQQAVQWVEEMSVVPGQRFSVVAKHDTYGLSFTLQPESSSDNVPERSVPLWDPLWKATFEELGKINENLSKGTVQNPLEFRATALAAVQIGSRPHDLGLDAEQAAAFCTRYMS
ncbi:g4363 [Coccomyxa elongata]